MKNKTKAAFKKLFRKLIELEKESILEGVSTVFGRDENKVKFWDVVELVKTVARKEDGKELKVRQVIALERAANALSGIKKNLDHVVGFLENDVDNGKRTD